jgi:hypothetical protein
VGELIPQILQVKVLNWQLWYTQDVASFYYWWLTSKHWTRRRNKSRKDKPVKPKSNSKLRRVWQNKVGPLVEAPLLEAPPQEFSSSKVNRGKHGTRDGQPPTTIVTAKSKLGGSILAPPHSATCWATTTTTSLGEKTSPVYPDKYFFSCYYS